MARIYPLKFGTPNIPPLNAPFLLDPHDAAEKFMAVQRLKNQTVVSPNSMLITPQHNLSSRGAIKPRTASAQGGVANIKINKQWPLHGKQALFLDFRERQTYRVRDQHNVAKRHQTTQVGR